MVDESKLIFIVSQPRAGSTLLQKLLSNNDRVDTVSEPWILLTMMSVFKPGLINAKYNYDLATIGFFDYLNKKKISEDFRKKFKNLILDLYQVSDSSLYFIDKTPRNYELLPQLMEFFPNARFIVLKRNPFASLHSMLSMWSSRKLNPDAIKTFYRDFLVAPLLIQDFCENYNALPNVKIVSYENILSDSESGIADIYNWLNIPFSAEVLEIGRNKKAAGLFGDDAQKANPLTEINSELKDAWKNVSEDGELLQFFKLYRDYLGSDFLKRYGYDDPFPEVQVSGKKDIETTTYSKRNASFILKAKLQQCFNFFGYELKKVRTEVVDKSNDAQIVMNSFIEQVKLDQLQLEKRSA